MLEKNVDKFSEKNVLCADLTPFNIKNPKVSKGQLRFLQKHVFSDFLESNKGHQN